MVFARRRPHAFRAGGLASVGDAERDFVDRVAVLRTLPLNPINTLCQRINLARRACLRRQLCLRLSAGADRRLARRQCRDLLSQLLRLATLPLHRLLLLLHYLLLLL